jgi:hypothetical protein
MPIVKRTSDTIAKTSGPKRGITKNTIAAAISKNRIDGRKNSIYYFLRFYP